MAECLRCPVVLGAREQEEREERQRVRQALGIADEPDPLDPHLSTLDENDPFTTNLCVHDASCCQAFVHARPAIHPRWLHSEAHHISLNELYSREPF
jgi:hypothetical protein